MAKCWTESQRQVFFAPVTRGFEKRVEKERVLGQKPMSMIEDILMERELSRELDYFDL